MNKKNNKGFTLAEMLIVVAIIGILIAILVPSMTSSLEKSREAADAANIRSAISELTVAYLNDDTTGTSGITKIGSADGAYKKEVTITQTVAGWANVTEIGGYETNKENNSTLAGLYQTVKGKITITVMSDGSFKFTK